QAADHRLVRAAAPGGDATPDQDGYHASAARRCRHAGRLLVWHGAAAPDRYSRAGSPVLRDSRDYWRLDRSPRNLGQVKGPTMRALDPHTTGFAANPHDGVRSYFEIYGPNESDLTLA